MTTTETPGDAANGAMLYASAKAACSTCHGTKGEGGIGPNITGSMTAGVGTWTQAQFFNAVRNGKARSGKNLCSFMPRAAATAVTDSGINDIFAFVKSTSVDTVNRGMGGPDCMTE